MAGSAAKRAGRAARVPERAADRSGTVARMAGADVVVVGSLNHDITVEADRRPAAGETVLGRSLAAACGGKGANQAVAAARAGARVTMVGCVGDDAAGEAMVGNLEAAGVATGGVRRADAPSGTALIVVDAQGENAIVVVPGANAELAADDVAATLAGDGPAPVVLAQLEVPEDAIAAAAGGAGRFVLNASPARELPRDVLAAADPLIVNAGEAAALAGAAGDDPEALAAAVLALGPRSVVVTLGADGARWTSAGATFTQPAPAVDVVDTTGAGDVFAGTLAARLARGDEPEAALAAAVDAGAAAVGWHGSPGAAMSRVPIVLDCDPGHDDAIALLLAAAHPALDLRAVSTVAGNGEIDRVTHNALAVCTLAGIRDVPVAQGAAGPPGATSRSRPTSTARARSTAPCCPRRTSRSTRAPARSSSPTPSPRRRRR